jgi:hypothetical protein
MEQSPTWKLTVIQLVKKFPPFYETRMFIMLSQEPAIGAYPDLDDSSPHLPPLFP